MGWWSAALSLSVRGLCTHLATFCFASCADFAERSLSMACPSVYMFSHTLTCQILGCNAVTDALQKPATHVPRLFTSAFANCIHTLSTSLALPANAKQVDTKHRQSCGWIAGSCVGTKIPARRKQPCCHSRSVCMHGAENIQQASRAD